MSQDWNNSRAFTRYENEDAPRLVDNTVLREARRNGEFGKSKQPKNVPVQQSVL
jgi:hypothetical protein